MLKRYHFNFKGNVQGVGFRFTLLRIAKSYNCTGYVKNLSDGTVEAQIQGDSQTIYSIIDKLKASPYIHIDDTIKQEIPLLEEKDFRIIY